jgi:hypothetical protein
MLNSTKSCKRLLCWRQLPILFGQPNPRITGEPCQNLPIGNRPDNVAKRSQSERRDLGSRKTPPNGWVCKRLPPERNHLATTHKTDAFLIFLHLV